MSEKKPIKKKVRASKYDEKLQVHGSFSDIMKAAMKDADNKSTKKKEEN